MEQVLGTVELAQRYGVKRPRAWQVVDEWRHQALPGPCPKVHRISGRNVVELADVEAWESWMRINDYPLPGEMPPGPRPKPYP